MVYWEHGKDKKDKSDNKNPSHHSGLCWSRGALDAELIACRAAGGTPTQESNTNVGPALGPPRTLPCGRGFRETVRVSLKHASSAGGFRTSDSVAPTRRRGSAIPSRYSAVRAPGAARGFAGRPSIRKQVGLGAFGIESQG